MTIKELQKALCEPGEITGQYPKNAILRLRNKYGFAFIEYPRTRLKKLFAELEKRTVVLETELEEPTETDRFLLIILKAMAADLS